MLIHVLAFISVKKKARAYIEEAGPLAAWVLSEPHRPGRPKALLGPQSIRRRSGDLAPIHLLRVADAKLERNLLSSFGCGNSNLATRLAGRPRTGNSQRTGLAHCSGARRRRRPRRS